jgi:hypothetical protein
MVNIIPFKKEIDNGHWLFPEQMGDGVGFIYIIRDRPFGKFYLGKKYFNGMRGKVKGVESNWRKYKSSSRLLDWTGRNMSEFDFICLEQYETKGTLSYSETWSLCYVEAPTNDAWYNKSIEKVFWNVREPITDRHKERLIKAVNMEKFE